MLQEESERWHAKAVHFAVSFMPEQCPLVEFVVQSYCKNYCNTKKEMQLLATKELVIQILKTKIVSERPPIPQTQ